MGESVTGLYVAATLSGVVITFLGILAGSVVVIGALRKIGR